MRKDSFRAGARVLSLLLVLSFGFSELGRFFPSEAFASEIVPSNWAPIAQDPSRFLVPSDFAALEDIHAGAPGSPLLIYVQDAHANVGGQQNIARFLDAVFTRYGTVPVLVEGGTKDDTLTSLKPQASASAWKKAARKFLLEGKISGDEYLNLTSEHPMRILGIEDAPAYRKGLEAYADLAEVREDALGRVKRLRAAAAVVKRTVYPETLRAFDDACSSDARLADCAKSLSESAGADYPNLQAFQTVLEKEKSVDFDAARLEQQAVFEKIGRSLSEADKKALTAKAVSGSDLSARAGEFALFAAAAARAGVVLESYPALTAYKDYLDSLRTIRFEEFSEEIERAKEARFTEAGEDIRDLHALDRRLALLEKAQEIRMSSNEYRELADPTLALTETALEAYLNRRLAERGSFRDLLPASEKLTRAAPLVDAFYRSAAERDDTFVRNAEKWMKAENADVAVLIAGGYHADALKKKFREKRWSYAVVSPHVTSETIQEKYERILLEPLRGERGQTPSQTRSVPKGSDPFPQSEAQSSGIVAARLAEDMAGPRRAELLAAAQSFFGQVPVKPAPTVAARAPQETRRPPAGASSGGRLSQASEIETGSGWLQKLVWRVGESVFLPELAALAISRWLVKEQDRQRLERMWQDVVRELQADPALAEARFDFLRVDSIPGKLYGEIRFPESTEPVSVVIEYSRAQGVVRTLFITPDAQEPPVLFPRPGHHYETLEEAARKQAAKETSALLRRRYGAEVLAGILRWAARERLRTAQFHLFNPGARAFFEKFFMDRSLDPLSPPYRLTAVSAFKTYLTADLSKVDLKPRSSAAATSAARLAAGSRPEGLIFSPDIFSSRLFRKYLSPRPGADVLEIGGGAGDAARELVRKGAARVWTTEKEAAKYRILRESVSTSAENSKIAAVQADLFDLPREMKRMRYDQIVVNPPTLYYARGNSNDSDPDRKFLRGLLNGAGALLKDGGTLEMTYQDGAAFMNEVYRAGWSVAAIRGYSDTRADFPGEMDYVFFVLKKRAGPAQAAVSDILNRLEKIETAVLRKGSPDSEDTSRLKALLKEIRTRNDFYGDWARKQAAFLMQGRNADVPDPWIPASGARAPQETRRPPAGASSGGRLAMKPIDPDALVGTVLLSFADNYFTSGGLSTHLIHLHKALAEIYGATIYQFYVPSIRDTAYRAPYEEDRFGRGKIVYVPLGDPVILSFESGRPLSFMDWSAMRMRAVVRAYFSGSLKGLLKYFLFHPLTLDWVRFLPFLGNRANMMLAVNRRFTETLDELAPRLAGHPTLFINHNPSHTLALMLDKIAARRGIPSAFEYHGGKEHADRLILKRLRRTSAASGVTLQGLGKILGETAVNLGNGIDTGKFAPSLERKGRYRRENGIDPDTFFVVYPARVEPAKGQMTMLKALKAYAARHPSRKITVHFAGEIEEGQYLNELNAYVLKNGLESRVRFTGRLSEQEIIEALQDASVAVLASDSEGVPRGLLEAEAMGTPVIGTDVGGTADAVVGGETGYLVRAGDSMALAERLWEFSENRTKRDAFGDKARQFIVEQFSIQSLARRHAEFYSRLLSGYPSPPAAAARRGARLAVSGARPSTLPDFSYAAEWASGEMLKALELETAVVVAVQSVPGGTVYRVRLPQAVSSGLPASGPDILYQHLAERKSAEFLLFYNNQKELTGILPQVTEPEKSHYYDLTAYNVPLDTIRSAVGRRPDFQAVARANQKIASDKAVLRAFADSIGFRGRLGPNALPSGKPYAFARIDARGRLHVIETHLSAFTLGEGETGVLFPIFPSVYHPAFYAKTADKAFYESVYSEALDAEFDSGDRYLDSATGSGFVAWLVWTAISRHGSSKGVQIDAYDLNPMAAATARTLLGKIAGIPAARVKLAGTVGAFGPSTYKLITGNAPAYDKKSGATESLEALWDNGEAGRAYWVDMSKNLRRHLTADGTAVFWNTRSDLANPDPVPPMFEYIGWKVDSSSAPGQLSLVYRIRRDPSGARLAWKKPAIKATVILVAAPVFGASVLVALYGAHRGLRWAAGKVENYLERNRAVFEALSRHFLRLAEEGGTSPAFWEAVERRILTRAYWDRAMAAERLEKEGAAALSRVEHYVLSRRRRDPDWKLDAGKAREISREWGARLSFDAAASGGLAQDGERSRTTSRVDNDAARRGARLAGLSNVIGAALTGKLRRAQWKMEDIYWRVRYGKRAPSSFDEQRFESWSARLERLIEMPDDPAALSAAHALLREIGRDFSPSGSWSGVEDLRRVYYGYGRQESAAVGPVHVLQALALHLLASAGEENASKIYEGRPEARLKRLIELYNASRKPAVPYSEASLYAIALTPFFRDSERFVVLSRATGRMPDRLRAPVTALRTFLIISHFSHGDMDAPDDFRILLDDLDWASRQLGSGRLSPGEERMLSLALARFALFAVPFSASEYSNFQVTWKSSPETLTRLDDWIERNLPEMEELIRRWGPADGSINGIADDAVLAGLDISFYQWMEKTLLSVAEPAPGPLEWLLFGEGPARDRYWSELVKRYRTVESRFPHYRTHYSEQMAVYRYWQFGQSAETLRGARLAAEGAKPSLKGVWNPDKPEADHALYRISQALENDPSILSESTLIALLKRMSRGDATTVERAHAFIELHRQRAPDSFGPAALSAAVDVLLGPNEDARDEMNAWVLGWFADLMPASFEDREMDRLTQALKSPDERIRGYAAFAVGHFAAAKPDRYANEHYLKMLAALMRDASGFVRGNAYGGAARLLGAVPGPKPSVDGLLEPVWNSLERGEVSEWIDADGFYRELLNADPRQAAVAAKRAVEKLADPQTRRKVYYLDVLMSAVKADPALAASAKEAVWSLTAADRFNSGNIQESMNGFYAMKDLLTADASLADREASERIAAGIGHRLLIVAQAAMHAVPALVQADPKRATRALYRAVAAENDPESREEKAAALLALYRARGDLRRSIEALDFEWPNKYLPLPSSEKPLDAYFRKGLALRINGQKILFWADWYTHPLLRVRNDRAGNSAKILLKDDDNTFLIVSAEGASELRLTLGGSKAADDTEVVDFKRNIPLKQTRVGRKFLDRANRLPSFSGRPEAIRRLLADLRSQRPELVYPLNPKQPFVWIGRTRLYLTAAADSTAMLEVFLDDAKEPRFAEIRDAARPEHSLIVEAGTFADNAPADMNAPRQLIVGGHRESAGFHAKLGDTRAGRRFLRYLSRRLEAMNASGNADLGAAVVYVSPSARDVSRPAWIKVPQITAAPERIFGGASFPSSFVDLGRARDVQRPQNEEEVSASAGDWLAIPNRVWAEKGQEAPEWLGYAGAPKRYGYYRSAGSAPWDDGTALYVSIEKLFEPVSVHFTKLQAGSLRLRFFTVDGIRDVAGRPVYFQESRRANLSALVRLLEPYDGKYFRLSEEVKRLSYASSAEPRTVSLPGSWKAERTGSLYWYISATGNRTIDPSDQDGMLAYLQGLKAAGIEAEKQAASRKTQEADGQTASSIVWDEFDEDSGARRGARLAERADDLPFALERMKRFESLLKSKAKNGYAEIFDSVSDKMGEDWAYYLYEAFPQIVYNQVWPLPSDVPENSDYRRRAIDEFPLPALIALTLFLLDRGAFGEAESPASAVLARFKGLIRLYNESSPGSYWPASFEWLVSFGLSSYMEDASLLFAGLERAVALPSPHRERFAAYHGLIQASHGVDDEPYDGKALLLLLEANLKTLREQRGSEAARRAATAAGRLLMTVEEREERLGTTRNVRPYEKAAWDLVDPESAAEILFRWQDLQKNHPLYASFISRFSTETDMGTVVGRSQASSAPDELLLDENRIEEIKRQNWAEWLRSEAAANESLRYTFSKLIAIAWSGALITRLEEVRKDPMHPSAEMREAWDGPLKEALAYLVRLEGATKPSWVDPSLPPPDARQTAEIGDELRNYWNRRGWNRTWGYFSQHAALLEGSFQKPQSMLQTNELIFALLGGSIDERLTGLWAKGVQVALHVREMGGYSENVDGEDRALDSEILAQTLRLYIPLLIYRLENPLPDGRQTVGYERGQYEDLLLWGLAVMTDPSNYVIHTRTDAQGKHHDVPSDAERTKKDIVFHLLGDDRRPGALRNLAAVDAQGRPTGDILPDKKIGDLMHRIMAVPGHGWVSEKALLLPWRASTNAFSSLLYGSILRGVKYSAQPVFSFADPGIFQNGLLVDNPIVKQPGNRREFFEEVFGDWPEFYERFPEIYGAGARLAEPSQLPQSVYAFLKSKYGAREMLRGGPIAQPAYFTQVLPESGWIDGLFAEYGRNNVSERRLPFLPASKYDAAGLRDLASKVETGEIAAPLVFKQNFGALGEGILFVERSGESGWQLTFMYAEQGPLSNARLEDVLRGLAKLPGVSVKRYPEQDIARVNTAARSGVLADVLTALWNELSTVRFMGSAAYDPGMAETMASLVHYRGSAYETRHAFLVDFKTNAVEWLKEKEDVRGWFARIGSSAYFSNQGLRKGKHSEYFSADMFKPLFKELNIPFSRIPEFERYVEASLKDELEFLGARLKQLSLHPGAAEGQIDLGWLQPAPGQIFPRPFLIETHFQSYSGPVRAEAAARLAAPAAPTEIEEWLEEARRLQLDPGRRIAEKLGINPSKVIRGMHAHPESYMLSSLMDRDYDDMLYEATAEYLRTGRANNDLRQYFFGTDSRDALGGRRWAAHEIFHDLFLFGLNRAEQQRFIEMLSDQLRISRGQPQSFYHPDRRKQYAYMDRIAEQLEAGTLDLKSFVVWVNISEIFAKIAGEALETKWRGGEPRETLFRTPLFDAYFEEISLFTEDVLAESGARLAEESGSPIRLGGAFAADPAAELNNPHMRALFMGILLNWAPANLREKLALLAGSGILVADFEPVGDGFRVNFYGEERDGIRQPAGSQIFSRAAIEEFRAEAVLSAEKRSVPPSGLGASEKSLYFNEENRQIRVFGSETAKITDRLDGLVTIDVGRLDIEGGSAVSPDFAENVRLLVHELETVRRDPRYADVVFTFTGEGRHVQDALRLGLSRFQGTPARIEAARARRSVRWTVDPEQEGVGYISVGYAKSGFAQPVRPLLYYSLYLLAVHHVPDDPHPMTAAQVSDRVLQEVSRLAGNPTGIALTREHVFGFAQGHINKELRDIALIYMIRPLVALLGARLAEYRERVFALGSSA